ncbi:hypothetical protein D3C85_1706840 [compost metagenome]
MHRPRSALRVDLFQHADLVVLAVLRVAAQGVRANQIGAQVQVDMGTCAKRRKRASIPARQGQQNYLALQFTLDDL